MLSYSGREKTRHHLGPRPRGQARHRNDFGLAARKNRPRARLVGRVGSDGVLLRRHVRRAGLSRRSGPPRQTGGTWPDYAIASAVTFHVLAALRHRNRTGEGQWIDASMGETVIGQMPEWYMDYFMNGRDRRQQGNRDDKMAPHNTYPCAGDDKWIAIAVGSQSEWEALCRAMGDPPWTRRGEVRRSIRPLEA